jgi:hypothetical protein
MSLFRKIVILGAIVSLALSIPASAPADISVDVSPAKYELQTAPGKSETFPILVRNTSNVPVHILASLNDFLVGPSGNYEFLPPGRNPYSIGKAISINPREFDLDPNTSMQVRFSVDVPANASGEYSSIVFFTTRPTRAQKGVSVAERIASKIYIIIPESSHFNGEIDDVSAKSLSDGQHYLVGFRNTGNVHVYLSGRIEIKQGAAVVEKLTLPQGILVEREGKRVVDAVGKKLPPGSYQAVALIDFGGPNLVAGQTSFTVR